MHRLYRKKGGGFSTLKEEEKKGAGGKQLTEIECTLGK